MNNKFDVLVATVPKFGFGERVRYFKNQTGYVVGIRWLNHHAGRQNRGWAYTVLGDQTLRYHVLKEKSLSIEDEGLNQ